MPAVDVVVSVLPTLLLQLLSELCDETAATLGAVADISVVVVDGAFSSAAEVGTASSKLC